MYNSLIAPRIRSYEQQLGHEQSCYPVQNSSDMNGHARDWHWLDIIHLCTGKAQVEHSRKQRRLRLNCYSISFLATHGSM
jgi:hypothetical protein